MAAGRRRYHLVALVAVLALMTAANLLWTSYQVGANNRKWCATVVLIDSAYRSKPPATPTGRELATDFGQLRRGFGCR